MHCRRLHWRYREDKRQCCVCRVLLSLSLSLTHLSSSLHSFRGEFSRARKFWVREREREREEVKYSCWESSGRWNLSCLRRPPSTLVTFWQVILYVQSDSPLLYRHFSPSFLSRHDDDSREKEELHKYPSLFHLRSLGGMTFRHDWREGKSRGCFAMHSEILHLHLGLKIEAWRGSGVPGKRSYPKCTY